MYQIPDDEFITSALTTGNVGKLANQAAEASERLAKQAQTIAKLGQTISDLGYRIGELEKRPAPAPVIRPAQGRWQ